MIDLKVFVSARDFIQCHNLFWKKISFVLFNSQPVLFNLSVVYQKMRVDEVLKDYGDKLHNFYKLS